jgi:hypothetical protein
VRFLAGEDVAGVRVVLPALEFEALEGVRRHPAVR